MKRKRAISIAGIAVVGALALIPGSAAAYSAACSSADQSGNASFASSRGEINNVSVGEYTGGGSGRGEAISYFGTYDDGGQYSGGVGCAALDSKPRVVVVSLGDGDDSVNSDGAETFGNDPLPLTKSVDTIYRGGSGDDTLSGHAGSGSIRGGSGDDVIKDPGGNDVLRGGLGDDTIKAKDGRHDLIICGGGDDRVVADPFDTLQGCR